MFMYADTSGHLNEHHRRVADMIRVAAEHKLARELSAGRRRRRFGRWPWRSRTPSPAPAAQVARAA